MDSKQAAELFNSLSGPERAALCRKLGIVPTLEGQLPEIEKAFFLLNRLLIISGLMMEEPPVK